MKISMTVIVKAALVAAFAVATAFVPGWLPVPSGTPTAHTVAAGQPTDLTPVGTPTAHGRV